MKAMEVGPTRKQVDDELSSKQRSSSDHRLGQSDGGWSDEKHLDDE